MYNLPEYKDHNPARVLEFMRAHPFIMICGVAADLKPVATQIPILIFEDEDGKVHLRGHMMKGTDHYKAIVQNPAVLAVFTSVHTYVSASWYTDQQVGSTWNYMAVHAKGRLEFLDNDALIEILRETTNYFERADSPSRFEHLSDEYVDRMSKAIAGFRIDVNDLQHVFKLSQDRDQNSFNNIVEKLDEGGASQRFIAEEMKLRK